jgi:hypothetical protein
MKNQHQIHHRAAEKAGDAERQLNALFNDPTHALTSALNDPSGHVLTLGIAAGVALMALWLISNVLGFCGKQVMPHPDEKYGLYWRKPSMALGLVLTCGALFFIGFAYQTGHSTGESSKARIQGATQQITVGP